MSKLKHPMVAEDAFLAEGSVVKGNIVIGSQSSIWYNTVLRSEEGTITIGNGTNLQDLSLVHTDPGMDLHIGNYVTIGHNAVIHNLKIGDNTLIGMGSILLNNAQIGSNCIIGAGSLVTEGAIIPDAEVWFGTPAKFKRAITEEEIKQNRESALGYIQRAKEHSNGEL